MFLGTAGRGQEGREVAGNGESFRNVPRETSGYGGGDEPEKWGEGLTSS